MADISKVTLPNGSTYDIKDATARTQISSEADTRKAADARIRQSIDELKSNLTGAMHYVGVTTTEITDGMSMGDPKASTNKITISGNDYKPVAGDVVIYQDKEFVFHIEKHTVGSIVAFKGVWNEFGSTGSLKALAFKDSASGSVTPSGTVSTPTFTGTAGTVSVSVRIADIIRNIELKTRVGTYDTASSSYTDPTSPESNKIMSTIVSPTAHVSGGKVTNTLTTASIKQVNTVGTLPTFSATVDNETLSFNFNAGSLPTTANTSVVTGVSSTLTNPTVEVSPFNIYGYDHSIKDIPATGTFTPQGTISQPTFTGNSSTVTVK